MLADEIMFDHGEIELQLFSLWCLIHFWLVLLESIFKTVKGFLELFHLYVEIPPAQF